MRRPVRLDLIVFHTAVGMTNALDAVAADGRRDTVSREALAGLGPIRPSTLTASATTSSTSASYPRRYPSRSRRGHSRRARRPHLSRQSLCEVLARIVAMVRAGAAVGQA